MRVDNNNKSGFVDENEGIIIPIEYDNFGYKFQNNLIST